MTTYQIRDWRDTYENNRSRAYKNCKFVCVPNNQDKEGMVRILSEPDGVALYGIWCLILGAASMHVERDGWLTGNGTQDGSPWTAEYMAIRWRTDAQVVQRLLDILVSDSVGWMTVQESGSAVQEKRSAVQDIGSSVQGIEQEPELEPELEQEEKEKATTTVRFGKPARQVFDHWVEVFGKDPLRSTFKASSKRYKKVVARLKDGKTVEELLRAVDGCHSDEWWRETGNHDLFKICESDEWVERFAGMVGRKKSGPPKTADEDRFDWQMRHEEQVKRDQAELERQSKEDEPFINKGVNIIMDAGLDLHSFKGREILAIGKGGPLPGGAE